MMHQTFTNGHDQPYIFMVEYLINLNNKDTLNGYRVLVKDHENQEKTAQLERQIKIKNEEIEVLRRNIAAFERQLNISPKPIVVQKSFGASSSSSHPEQSGDKSLRKTDSSDSDDETVLKSSDSDSEPEELPAQAKKSEKHEVKKAEEPQAANLTDLQSDLQLSEDSDNDVAVNNEVQISQVLVEIDEKMPEEAAGADPSIVGDSERALGAGERGADTEMQPTPSVIDFTQLVSTKTEKKFIEPVAQVTPEVSPRPKMHVCENTDDSDIDDDLVIDEHKQVIPNRDDDEIRSMQPEKMDVTGLPDPVALTTDDSESDSSKMPLRKKVKLESLEKVIKNMEAKSEGTNRGVKAAELAPKVKKEKKKASSADGSDEKKDCPRKGNRTAGNRSESIEMDEFMHTIALQLKKMQSPDPETSLTTAELRVNVTEMPVQVAMAQPSHAECYSIEEETLDLDFEPDF